MDKDHRDAFLLLAMVPFFLFSAQGIKRLSVLLAAPAAMLLSPGKAEAILTYTIFQSGSDVVVEASGSLDLTGDNGQFGFSCGQPAIIPNEAVICAGPQPVTQTKYNITGPIRFNFDPDSFFEPAITTGTSTALNGAFGSITLPPDYVSLSPIVSSTRFSNRTLAELGLTTEGLIGTWNLRDTTTRDAIQVVVSHQVPGPLPLLGAAAAFGWSRRLRRRAASSNATLAD